MKNNGHALLTYTSTAVSDTVSSVQPRRVERIVMLLAFILFGTLQIFLADYIVDDTFIHLTFARNLASGFGFSFNPNQPVNGITAPLWTLILAFFSLIFTTGPGLAKSLSILSGALTIPAFRSLARRAGLTNRFLFPALLIWAVNVWLARWSASGMESSFALLLLILAFDAHLAGKSANAGLYLGLAILCRPEAAGLIIVFAIDQGMQSDYRAATKVILTSILPILIWLGYSLWTFESLIPNPALIKSDALLPPVGDVFLGLRRTAEILLSGNGLEILISFVAIAVFFYQRNTPPIDFRLAGLLIIWSLFPAFTCISRGVFVQSRYLLIGIPPLIISGFLALKWLLNFRNELLVKRVVSVLAVVIFLQQILMTSFVTIPHVETFKPTVATLVQISEKIEREAPPDALVAVGDVGIVGFYCGRRVLDLEGLVSSEIVPHRLGLSLDQFILSGTFFKAGSPDYLIDKSRDPKRLEGKWNAEIIEIYPVPGGLIETAGQSWYYTLYRLPS